MLSLSRFPFRIAAALLFIAPCAAAQNGAVLKAPLAAAPPAVKPANPPVPKPAPPVSKDPQDWLTRFNKIVGAKGMDSKTQMDFDGLDPDAAYRIYSEISPQIKSETVRRGAFRIVLAKTKAPEVVDREPGRLLAVLDLGLKDPDPMLRKNALQAISPLLLRSFETPAQWADWRKTSGSKPLPQILREDCDALAAAFSTASYERKTEIFALMGRAAYQNGYSAEKADGKITRRLKANGLNAMRRKAVADSGLFDALTLPLRGAASDELAERSLQFVRAYRPDEAQMQRIDPALRHQMEARFSDPDAQINGSLELLTAVKSDWAMPLLIKTIQNNYLNSSSRVTTAVLTKANDVRALPLLIELLPTANAQENTQMKTAIAALEISPEPKETLAKRDAKGWQDWWAKNKADYPADVQALTLGPLKTGVDAMIVRLENSGQQYGMNNSATQQFQALSTEERYRVLQSVWGLELDANVKTSLLYTFNNDAGAPDPKDPKGAKKGNPRWLDAMALGMMDANGELQQAAAQIIFQKTMQSFPDLVSFVQWRKRSAGHPMRELALEGAKSFVAQFNAAPENGKAELLTKTYRVITFNSGVKMETKDGKTTRVVLADGETEARRKILADGGIVAQAGAMLLSNNEAAASAAANFLEQFLPDDSAMPPLEAGLKKVYTRWITNSDEQFYPQFSFMLLYKSAWVGDLMTQAMQNVSGSPYYRKPSPAQELSQSEDKRVIPLLIDALSSQAKPQQAPTLQRLAKLTSVKFDAKQDEAYWRKWWDANKAGLPEEARVMKLTDGKTLASAKDALIDKLVKSKDGLDFEVYYAFETADAEMQWAVIKEGWKKITNKQMKSFLFSMTMNIQGEPNPKLKPEEAEQRRLEFIGLAIEDKEENIRKQASDAVYNYAFREIKDAASYAAWRKEIGAKPLADVVKQAETDALMRLQKADAKTLPQMLTALEGVEWGSRYYYYFNADAPIPMQGLTGVRRKTALALKLPDTLARLMKSDQTPEVNQKALTLLHTFRPGQAFFARVEPDAARILPLLANKQAGSEYMTLGMINAYRGKWATDLLLETAKKGYAGNSYVMCYMLAQSKSPRVVPTLIAIMEDEDGESYLRSTVARALARLTHTTENNNHNGAWWRRWWQRNRAQMPEEARNETIPDLLMGNRYARTFSIRRGRKLETIAHDAHRAYWRLSSGFIISEKTKIKVVSPAAKTTAASDKTKKTIGTKPGGATVKTASSANVKTANSGAKTAANGAKTATGGVKATAAKTTIAEDAKPAAPLTAQGIPMANRPGLLVVVGDGDTDIALQAGYWQDVAGRGFGGHYLVALVSPPKWREKQKTLWLTRKNRGEVPEAAFTTETLAADVARDMEAKYPINPAHVFLIGEGDGGPATYACSLEARTPFKGFLMLQTAFKSALLPSLANAKNRRYYLLHSHEDKRVPYFAATMAQNTLRAQGATVKLSPATPNPDAAQQATWEEAAEGVKWLEKNQ